MLVFYFVFGVCSVLAQEDPSLQEFKDGNLKLTPELYKLIAPLFKDKNFVFTPLCFQLGAALLQAGAKGVTGEQLRRGVHLPSNQEQANKAAYSVYTSLTGDKSFVLDLAGKIFLPQNQAVKSSFPFPSFVENVDYNKSNVADVINAWVRNSTHNKIDNLVTSREVNAQTLAFLAKAVEFQANWTYGFSSKESQNGDFYRNRTDVIRADYIYQHGYTYNYRECGKLDAYFLELPLGDAILTIVLPRTKNGIDKLENGIENVFTSHDYKKSTVHLQLPKFSIETKIVAKAVLQALGITAAFNKNEADFSGLSGNKGELDLTNVDFKTKISINEGGIEVPPTANAPLIPPTTPSGTIYPFIVDHAFIYYVKANGTITIAGRVLRPN